MEDVFNTEIKKREYQLFSSQNPVTILNDDDDDGVDDDIGNETGTFKLILSRRPGDESDPVDIPTRTSHQTSGVITVYVHYQAYNETTDAYWNVFETHVYNYVNKDTNSHEDDTLQNETLTDQLLSDGSGVLELVDFAGDAVILQSSMETPRRTLDNTTLKMRIITSSGIPNLRLTFEGELKGLLPDGFKERIKIAAVAKMSFQLIES